MQIRLIPYQKIDFTKYDEVVENSKFSTVYALSWYLDVVTNKNWSVLVCNDYEFVMPVPFARLKRNLMLKSVVQPMFCQQLGIFSKEESKEIYDKMIAELKKLRFTNYNLNESLSNHFPELNKRNNFILDLNKPYQEIYDNYRKDRQKDIRRGERNNWLVEDFSDTEFYMKELLSNSDYLKQNSAKTLKELLSVLNEKNLLVGKKILNQDKQWMAIAFWVKSFDRMVLLTSVRNTKFDKKGAFACLVDGFIKQYSSQNLIFDFEGSMIEGVADFNASFGAENSPYPIF